MKEYFNVAFFVNRLALIGLGVTISSLVRNCSDTNKLKINIFCSDLTEADNANLISLLEREGFKGKVDIIKFDPMEQFGHLRSLHGDWTTYGRLLLPELLPDVDVILYLDADLVVEVDVLELQTFDHKGSGLAAVFGAKLSFALDHTFLAGKLGRPLDSDYFNAGVTFFNLAKWRSDNLKKKCMAIANQYPNELISHDQTLLNAVFSDTYQKLPAYFNCTWYAHAPQPAGDHKKILHYVGAPKPWDIGGSLLHNGYKVWNSYLDKGWARQYKRTSMGDVDRAWQIRRSYLRLLKKKLLNK